MTIITLFETSIFVSRNKLNNMKNKSCLIRVRLVYLTCDGEFISQTYSLAKLSDYDHKLSTLLSCFHIYTRIIFDCLPALKLFCL